MIFKNLQIYRLGAPWYMTAERLAEQLAEKPFRPCGSQDMESRGWLPPVSGGPLVHTAGDHWLVTLGVEQRMPPASAVNRIAIERAAELAERQGHSPGRKQMKALLDQVTQELLPRAFPRLRRISAWIDPINGWLVVDAASRARAEDVLEYLRQTLDSFPLRLLRTAISPTAAMTDWLLRGEAPAGFAIDDDVHLRSVWDDGSEAIYRREHDSEQVRAHIEAGRLPVHLAMTFTERVSFVLTEKMEIKRLNFLDLLTGQADSEQEDAESVFSAELALMAGELVRLLPHIVAALGGEVAVDAGLVVEEGAE